MDKVGYVYILTNKINSVLYVGVTSNLTKRVWEHKNKAVSGFTARYNLNKLVYYEKSESILSAIEKEKQIKGGSRKKKTELIHSMNPLWKDLYEDII
jgi:putative endonuclease